MHIVILLSTVFKHLQSIKAAVFSGKAILWKLMTSVSFRDEDIELSVVKERGTTA
jgi:hypothetical protein